MNRPTLRSQSSIRRVRRAFTLLELVLAMAIGSLVVLAAFGIFSLMRSAERRTEQRAEAAINMAELHSCLQKSLSSIVVEVKQKPARPAIPAGQLAGAAAKADPAAGSSGKDQDKEKSAENDAILTGPPRLNLVTPDAGTQRLEMMVAQAPLAVKMPEGFTGFGTPELGGGIWSAIEFRRDESTGLITAWWRVFREQVQPERSDRSVRRPKGARERLQDRINARDENRAEGAAGDEAGDPKSTAEAEQAEEEARPPVLELAGERQIADGFVSVDMSFKATRDDPDRPGEAARLMDVKNMTARTADELPAYVVVEVEHKDGLRGQWTFECVYVQSRASRPMADPAEVLRKREAGSAAKGADRTGGATSGAGGTGGPKPGGGSTGGGPTGGGGGTRGGGTGGGGTGGGGPRGSGPK